MVFSCFFLFFFFCLFLFFLCFLQDTGTEKSYYHSNKKCSKLATNVQSDKAFMLTSTKMPGRRTQAIEHS